MDHLDEFSAHVCAYLSSILDAKKHCFNYLN